MIRLLVVLVTVPVGSTAYAQSAPSPRQKHQKAAPAAQPAEDPNDIASVPRNVQKWFGGAVDDILTGADLKNDKR